MPTSAFASKTTGGNTAGAGAGTRAGAAALSTDGDAFSGTGLTFAATGSLALRARLPAALTGEGGGITADGLAGDADGTAGCNADGSDRGGVDSGVGTEGSTPDSRSGAERRCAKYTRAT